MNILDKAIGFFSPKRGYERVQARARMNAMDQHARRWEGATEGRRHAGWSMRTNPSINELINRDHKNLINRSRELEMNNSYAKKAPVIIANNVVGTGILPTPNFIKRVNGKISPVKGRQLENLNSQLKAAWNDWAGKITCDYDGNFTCYGLQHLAMSTIVTSGEVLVIKRSVTTNVNPYGLQLQVVEGDFIDKSKNEDRREDGGRILYGVQFDKNNKRTGYWIYDRHPSEGNAKSNFISVNDIIHTYRVFRAGQTRGVPEAAATIVKQRDLDDYEDAELLGKKTSACMPIFVTQNSPETDGTTNEPIETVEPGMINYLNPGEQVTFASPPANNGFESFTKTQHRAIAAGYFMTYEQLTGDLSNVNFSSGRMGWIEFSRMAEYWQYNMLIPKFCDKIYEWFVEYVRIMYSIPKEIEITATWTAPRRAMIDPSREISAMNAEVRSGFTSWSEIVRANGYNPDEVIEQLKQDYQRFKEAGLIADWNPGLSMQAAAKQNNNPPK